MTSFARLVLLGAIVNSYGLHLVDQVTSVVWAARGLDAARSVFGSPTAPRPEARVFSPMRAILTTSCPRSVVPFSISSRFSAIKHRGAERDEVVLPYGANQYGGK